MGWRADASTDPCVLDSGLRVLVDRGEDAGVLAGGSALDLPTAGCGLPNECPRENGRVERGRLIEAWMPRRMDARRSIALALIERSIHHRVRWHGHS